MKAWLAALLFALPAFGIYNVGDKVADKCYDSPDIRPEKYCLLNGIKGKFISVIFFSAGWCGPCNSEWAKLVPALEKYKGNERVTFFGLLGEGWSGGAPADDAFLTQWGNKFGVAKAESYWLLVSSKRDFGRDFFSSPSIPNTVILDIDGKVVFKAIAPGVKKVIEQVDKLLKLRGPHPGPGPSPHPPSPSPHPPAPRPNPPHPGPPPGPRPGPHPTPHPPSPRPPAPHPHPPGPAPHPHPGPRPPWPGPGPRPYPGPHPYPVPWPYPYPFPGPVGGFTCIAVATSEPEIHFYQPTVPGHSGWSPYLAQAETAALEYCWQWHETCELKGCFR